MRAEISSSSSVTRSAASGGKAAKTLCTVLNSRRTTVTLSPEAQEIVERYKSASGASTSSAIDQIIRRSEPKPSRLKEVNGFLVMSAPPNRREGVRRVTLEDIRRAEDEMDHEYVGRILHRERKSTQKKEKKPGRR